MVVTDQVIPGATLSRIGREGRGFTFDLEGYQSDVTAPTEAPTKDITEFLASANRDALYADFITGLTNELWPASVRGGAYQRMLALLTTNSTQ